MRKEIRYYKKLFIFGLHIHVNNFIKRSATFAQKAAVLLETINFKPSKEK